MANTQTLPKLRTYTLNHSRSDPAAVFSADEAADSWYSDLEDETVMRTIETDRFRVEFVAHQERDLDLSWLHTKARVTDDGELVIEKSMRYDEGEIERFGAEKVVQWINEDHKEMHDIVSAYLGLSDRPRVFRAEVRVVHKRSGAVLGNDFLSNCIYETYDDFARTPGYAYDLVQTAVYEARESIADLCA